jgi:hypothetical protein
MTHNDQFDLMTAEEKAKALKIRQLEKTRQQEMAAERNKSISKYYHWHAVIEERLKKLKEFHDDQIKKLTRRERLSQALQGLSQLKERIPAMPKVGLPGSGAKEAKEKEDASTPEKEDKQRSE